MNSKGTSCWDIIKRALEPELAAEDKQPLRLCPWESRSASPGRDSAEMGELRQRVRGLLEMLDRFEENCAGIVRKSQDRSEGSFQAMMTAVEERGDLAEEILQELKGSTHDGGVLDALERALHDLDERSVKITDNWRPFSGDPDLALPGDIGDGKEVSVGDVESAQAQFQDESTGFREPDRDNKSVLGADLSALVSENIRLKKQEVRAWEELTLDSAGGEQEKAAIVQQIKKKQKEMYAPTPHFSCSSLRFGLWWPPARGMDRLWLKRRRLLRSGMRLFDAVHIAENLRVVSRDFMASQKKRAMGFHWDGFKYEDGATAPRTEGWDLSSRVAKDCLAALQDDRSSLHTICGLSTVVAVLKHRQKQLEELPRLVRKRDERGREIVEADRCAKTPVLAAWQRANSDGSFGCRAIDRLAHELWVATNRLLESKHHSDRDQLCRASSCEQRSRAVDPAQWFASGAQAFSPVDTM